MKIALVGMMGVGKSTLGKEIAKMIDLPFVDLDVEIEQTIQMSIADYFHNYSELEFRKIERSILQKYLSESDNFVMATGGGAIENIDLFNGFDEIIWVKRNYSLIKKVDNSRPLINKYEMLAKLREPMYAKVSTITLNNDGDILETLKYAKSILTNLNKNK